MVFLGLDIAMRGAFYVLLAIFTIYSLFLAYHWFTYGSDRKVNMIALASYLLGSAVCFIVMSIYI